MADHVEELGSFFKAKWRQDGEKLGSFGEKHNWDLMEAFPSVMMRPGFEVDQWSWNFSCY